jgi:hypothetical protein
MKRRMGVAPKSVEKLRALCEKIQYQGRDSLFENLAKRG